jgi:hypothetical protein
MKNIIKKISVMIALLLVMTVLPTAHVYAATANVSVSSATATNGSEVTVTVSISGDENIAMVDLWLSYDSSILEYVSGADVGGGGSIRLLSTDNTSFSIKFKAISAGTASVSVNTAQSVISSLYTDKMSVSAANGSVTVAAPVSYSSDNNLKSLSISPGTLSPAFSADVTTYNTSVPSDCTRLVISAVASDSKAKISIWGAALDPGDNTTKITVTAENGSQKVYTIYTKRPVEQTTQAVQTGNEKPTQAPQTDVVVTIGEQNYFIISNFDENVLPEGYEAEEYTYKGSEIVAGKGLSNGLILFYLETAEDSDSVKSFFIYDEETDEFTPLQRLNSKAREYTILTDEAGTLPDKYVSTKLELGGQKIEVWVENTEEPKYFLFYGMNVEGNKGWYRYDLTENTIQNAFSITNSGQTISEEADGTQETQPEETAVSAASAQDYQKIKEEYDQFSMKMKMVVLILVILLAAVIVILIVFIIKSFSHAAEYDISENYDITEDLAEDITEDITEENKDDDDSVTFIDLE